MTFDKDTTFYNRPFISIIITTLNGGRTIDCCLSSIVEQQFDSYELIIVDGGSTDDTIDRIETYRSVVTKLVICPGIGLYAGLNAGIRMASGVWLYFMGCDDQLLAPTTLQQVTAAMAAATRRFVIAAGSVRYQDDGFVMGPSFGSPYLMRYMLHHQGTFYHHSLFQNHHYNEALQISSDYEFNIRLALRQEPYLKLELIVALYGQNGVSSRQSVQNFKEIQAINAQLFGGLGRRWILSYHTLINKLWSFRRKAGLLNLKVKLARFITFSKLTN